MMLLFEAANEDKGAAEVRKRELRSLDARCVLAPRLSLCVSALTFSHDRRWFPTAKFT